MNEKIKNTVDALERNNMKAFYAETIEEAAKIALGLVNDGDTISHGGSVTLSQLGLIDEFKSGRYNYLDRSKPGLSPENVMEIYRKTFSADAYFTSSNAVTVNGELYNVDGNSNRVAAMLFGPKKVIVIVGVNKIVDNILEAAERVKKYAAPPNCVRLNKETYCASKGKCVTADDENAYFCDGCTSPDRICRNYTVMSAQRTKDRGNVIIVSENLGY